MKRTRKFYTQVTHSASIEAMELKERKVFCCGYCRTDLNLYLRNGTQQHTLFPKFMLNVSIIHDLLAVRYVQATIFVFFYLQHAPLQIVILHAWNDHHKHCVYLF
jgi:hypothetical protein